MKIRPELNLGIYFKWSDLRFLNTRDLKKEQNKSVVSTTIHRHFYGFSLGQKTDHTNDDDHKHDGGDHKNDGGLENQILAFFSRHILLREAVDFKSQERKSRILKY